MSILSPNSLFHFTPNINNLLGILNYTFYPRYCYEEFDLIDDGQQPFTADAIAMVCFCDIPLSQLMNHIKIYGNYGLGLTKEWGIKKKLNPVIYFNKNSLLAQSLSIITDGTRLKKDPVSLAYHETMQYFKPYEGKFYRGESLINDRVRFYDEHEWRYIPDRKIMIENKIHTSMQTHVYRNTEELKKANRKLEIDLIKLSFNADDIKYVIIKEEKEINKMVNSLRDIKGSRYDSDTLDRLISRIITVKQIQDDF
jgi:hypothetical protein